MGGVQLPISELSSTGYTASVLTVDRYSLCIPVENQGLHKLAKHGREESKEGVAFDSVLLFAAFSSLARPNLLLARCSRVLFGIKHRAIRTFSIK